MPGKNIVRHIIELGYGLPDAGGVMWFRVGASVRGEDFDEMLNVLCEIEYGEFDGQRVATMLAMLAGERVISLVEFGREYSPVLYLHPDPAQGIGIARTLRSGRAAAVDSFVRMLAERFQIVPDEAGWDKSRGCLRLWWD